MRTETKLCNDQQRKSTKQQVRLTYGTKENARSAKLPKHTGQLGTIHSGTTLNKEKNIHHGLLTGAQSAATSKKQWNVGDKISRNPVARKA